MLTRSMEAWSSGQLLPEFPKFMGGDFLGPQAHYRAWELSSRQQEGCDAEPLMSNSSLKRVV